MLTARLHGRLEPGGYLYCGSAKGPGGLKARIARHLRTDKKPHWHVDRLTAAALKVTAWAYVGGDECALVRALAPLPHPIPGFGSSDCPTCPSHLLAWPEGVEIDFTGLINGDGHTRMTKSGG